MIKRKWGKETPCLSTGEQITLFETAVFQINHNSIQIIGKSYGNYARLRAKNLESNLACMTFDWKQKSAPVDENSKLLN